MFPHLTNFNLQKWIDENRGDWGRRRTVWEDSDFIVFVTRGPNDRTDFHIDPGDEIFFQLEGQLNLHYLTSDQNHEVAVVNAGELFLLPASVPHSPRRGEGSWTLVVERIRRSDEEDKFIWICDKCNATIYTTTIKFNDPADAVKEAYEALESDEAIRTCSQCGQIATVARSDGPAHVWKGASS